MALRVAVVVLLYLWLVYVLLEFPYSQPWGQQLGGFLIDLFEKLGTGLLQSIPGIFTVAVIFLITRIVSRVLRRFFSGVESGTIQFSWLHPDTASASRHIVVALLWVFAITVAYPYIPGSNTDAFKGVSVLVGLMVSLGSAGFVNQIMSGLVVVYSRGLRPGEFVRIGDDVGTVLEVGMLSTKIRTPKREDITIPNGVLVGTRTVNYSRHERENGAVVGTTVTIGYDVPWRQVHAMLLRAAEQTSAVRRNPAPRVHQKALSDFFVEYELIFNIDDPAERVSILSELHTRIQDVFNEEGVQIMSPHFESQPSEKIFVPKSAWFPKPTQASAVKDRR
jgi:small-conductance mechanosensitive channel